MFENEIKRIYSHNLNKVKNLGSYINFEQLISANLHPAILHYISAEIDFRIFEDRQKILKDSVFDYSGEKIRNYFSQISKELKKNKRFSQQYTNKLILHAVSFNVNYLARPKWALLKFIYNNTSEKPADEIKQVLNYIHYYAYLRKILTLYIEKKNILILSKGEFKDLLTKVDESGIESNQKAIVDKALESMTEFFNVGLTDQSLVPLPAVKLFFQEKNLLPQLNKINHKFGVENKDLIELDEIKKALIENEPSLDEESEKIIKELVEQETGFTKTGLPESEPAEQIEASLDEITADDEIKEESIQTEEDVFDEEETEDLSEGFVQNNLEDNDFDESDEINEPVTTDESNEGELIDESDSIEINEELEEGEVIPENGMPDVNELETVNEEEIQFNPKDSDDSELIIESELSSDEELDLDGSSLTLDDEQKEKSDLRLIDSNVNKNETPNNELEIEESLLEVSDEEATGEEEIEHDEVIEEEAAEEEETIEIKDDVFVEETVEENDDEEPEVTESDDHYLEDEKSDLNISDDDTLSGIIEDEFESDLQKIDMSDLVQNKKMTKIIEVIFDYDMEDYSNTIERISECSNLDDAQKILEKLFSTNRINTKSKEAHLFKELISEYFN